jgi:uncharacterized SAM-binding protein YcdF (DUF218 family)
MASQTRPLSSSPRGGAMGGVLVRAVFVVLLLLAAVAVLWTRWVYLQIEHDAVEDQAAPADAIAVFGAAEYSGHPSPVYHARLDHALELYHRNIAPLIITLGGDGGDRFSEGGVGRQYLMAKGVPEGNIIAETVSHNTEDSARRVAVIARANGLKRLVIVSDRTHLFRIHAICAAEGLDVLTSPRPRVEVENNPGDFKLVAHEILTYTLWRLHLH